MFTAAKQAECCTLLGWFRNVVLRQETEHSIRRDWQIRMAVKELVDLQPLDITFDSEPLQEVNIKISH